MDSYLSAIAEDGCNLKDSFKKSLETYPSDYCKAGVQSGNLKNRAGITGCSGSNQEFSVSHAGIDSDDLKMSKGFKQFTKEGIQAQQFALTSTILRLGS